MVLTEKGKTEFTSIDRLLDHLLVHLFDRTRLQLQRCFWYFSRRANRRPSPVNLIKLLSSSASSSGWIEFPPSIGSAQHRPSHIFLYLKSVLNEADHKSLIAVFTILRTVARNRGEIWTGLENQKSADQGGETIN